MRLLLSFFVLIATTSHAESEIIATIKPLQLIADALAEGVTEVELLTSISANPHDMALKPSEMRRLVNAKLILWVGPDFDHYLAKSAETLARKSQLLAMSDGAEQSAQNSHLWLDPLRAEKYAAELREELIVLFPEQASRIKKNHADFVRDLTLVLDEISARLAPLKRRPYLVYHDAYTHFEKRFSLESLGIIQPNHMGPVGAKRLMRLKKQAQQHDVRCVITESSGTPREVRIIEPRSSFKIVEIDPLAREIERGRRGYINFLQSITRGYELCLS